MILQSFLWGKAGRGRTVQSEEKATQGKAQQHIQTTDGKMQRLSQAVFLLSNDRTKSSEKRETQKELYDYQKTAFFFYCNWTLKQLPRNDCGIFILETLKSHLDPVLGNLLSVALLEQGGGSRSNLDPSVILWYFIHSTHEFVFYLLSRHSGIDNHLFIYLSHDIQKSQYSEII